MNITFENKRILVTGGCRGIGKELCIRLSKYRGIVIALSNNKENLDKLSKEHPNIQTLCIDLLNWDATKEIVQSVLPIDLLVNNAGVGKFSSCLTASSEDFDLIFGVNVKAMLNVSQVVGQNMVERKIPGSIVNISSQCGRGAIQGSIIYCSSKAAVNMLTKTMALELGPNKIRVNCILPTVVMTELGKAFISDQVRSDLVKSRISLGRLAELDEIVDTVVYLLSDRSSMITGVELPVDGGYSSS